MLKSLVKALSISACLASSSMSLAVGMGGINVTSALGQPLKADIELVALTKAEKASLVARLASPDTYKNAGLDYPYNNKFRFEIANRASGEPYLKITSDQPVQDPFVVMMVELNWSSGRLVREYTFLLDPPNYVVDQPAANVVQPVAPIVQAVPATEAVVTGQPPVAEQSSPVVEPVAAPVAESIPAPAPAEPAPVAIKHEPVKPAPATEVAKPEPKPASAPSAKGRFDIAAQPAPRAAKATADSYTVQKGDTLSKIASENISSNMSLERALVALYRANANQFDGQNMNRLSSGKVLHLPSEKEISNVTQSDAVTEIRAQAQDWNAYRQKLAGAATPSAQTQTTQQVVKGKVSSTVADQTPTVKESAKEVLKLSKGEMPTDKAVTGTGGKTVTAQEKKNVTKEEQVAQAKAAKESQTRTALLEKNLKDMEKLAQLKVEQAALAQKQQPPEPAAAPQPKAVSAVVAAKPAVQPKAKEIKPETSMLDAVLQEPTYLAGGAVALLGLLGLGWKIARRRKIPQFQDADDIPQFSGDQDIGSTTGRMATPVAPSPDSGDFTQTGEAAVVQPQPYEQHAEDVDPISEADLFLNFGRDAQAEEILKEALNNTPDNHQIHLKLLEIYAKRKDTAAFENIARQLKESGDEAAFNTASDMGRGIDPRNPLYGGSVAIEDASSATMQAPAFINPPATASAGKPAEVDFDLGAEIADEQPAAPVQHFLDDTQKVADAPVAPEKSELPNLDQLIFDVTGSHPTLQMEKPPVEETKPVAADSVMEFTLDFPSEATPVKAVTPEAKPSAIDKTPAIDFAGISLNLDGDDTVVNQPSPSESDDANWQEVATKLDLAKAYQEMGDGPGAREILEEVLREGNAEQRATAQELISQIA